MIDVTAQRPKCLIEQEEEGELQKGSEATQRNEKGELFTRVLWKLQVLD